MIESRKFRFGCLAILVMLVTPLVILFTSEIRGKRRLLADFEQCNHADLLSACREMAANKNRYAESKYCVNGVVDGTVGLVGGGYPDYTEDGLYPEWEDDIPKPIRDLNPKEICIDSYGRVFLLKTDAGLTAASSSICAYPEGEAGSGDRMFIEGLWYWDR